MPRYDYTCDKCGHQFTVQRHMSARAAAPACPKCRATTTRQQFSPFYAKTIKKS